MYQKYEHARWIALYVTAVQLQRYGTIMPHNSTVLQWATLLSGIHVGVTSRVYLYAHAHKNNNKKNRIVSPFFRPIEFFVVVIIFPGRVMVAYARTWNKRLPQLHLIIAFSPVKSSFISYESEFRILFLAPKTNYVLYVIHTTSQ